MDGYRSSPRKSEGHRFRYAGLPQRPWNPGARGPERQRDAQRALRRAGADAARSPRRGVHRKRMARASPEAVLPRQARPTVPVSRTHQGVAEGKDELILKALEVVKRPK